MSHSIERGSATPTAVKRWVKLQQAFGAALVVLIVSLVCLQIAGRFVLERPIIWTGELSRFALVWLVFLSAAFVMVEGQHITIKLVDRLLRPRWRRVLDLASLLVVVGTAVALLPSIYRFTAYMHGVSAPASRLPMSAFFAAALVGFSLLAVNALIRTYLVIKRGPAQYTEVHRDYAKEAG